MKKQIIIILSMVATSLSCMDGPEPKDREFQSKFKAAFAARMQAHEDKKKQGIPDDDADTVDEELLNLRMKLRHIDGIPEDEPSYFPEMLAGSSAAFFGANSLAQANSARFILEASAALTAIKLAAAIAASSYIVYKIRHFMRDEEGTKKFRKEYKEDMTHWKREFSHQAGKLNEQQEKFEEGIRKDFRKYKDELDATYQRRKEKTKAALKEQNDKINEDFAKHKKDIEDLAKKNAKEFATHHKDLKEQTEKNAKEFDKFKTTCEKEIENKLKDKHELHTKQKKELEDLIVKLETQMKKDREEFDRVIAETRELGKKEKEELKKMIHGLQEEIDYESQVRAKQAKEVEGLRNAVALIDRKSYKKFMEELDAVKKSMDEQPKRTVVDRILGRPGKNPSTGSTPGHSRHGSFASPPPSDMPTQGTGSTHMRGRSMSGATLGEGGRTGSFNAGAPNPPVGRPQMKRLSFGTLNPNQLAELAELSHRANAQEEAQKGGREGERPRKATDKTVG